MAASLKLFREQKAPWAPGGLSPPPHAIILFLLRLLPGWGEEARASRHLELGPPRLRPRKRAPPGTTATRKRQELSRAPTEHLTGRELSWELHGRSSLSDNPI